MLARESGSQVHCCGLAVAAGGKTLGACAVDAVRQVVVACVACKALGRVPKLDRGFFFFIFKKNKISKIYVCFQIFQKYTPVALPKGDRPIV